MPRVFQQIDWSNGGDGIVVRDNIKTVADLRDKKLVLAQNSPSQYFALNMLVAGGDPAIGSGHDLHERRLCRRGRLCGRQAENIAGAVSWSPDIYNLAKVKGNRMLVTTQTANKLIRTSGSPGPTSPRTIRASSRPWSAASSTPWSS